MRLCTTHPAVRRTWTVELRPERGGPVLHCPQCPPGRPPVRGAASQALAHLARHARHDALPQHLRTCQCHPHGCRWHPRHRGCSGPVLLVLTREHGGRLWRLADVCAACAAATTHAAVVPDTVLAPAPSAQSEKRARQRQRRTRPCGPSEQLRVREMLSYLAAALPAQTSAPARLLALQCALRSTAVGTVSIPTGLVRGMQLGPGTEPFDELHGVRWLHTLAPSQLGSEGFTAQLLDVGLRTQAPARGDRARAADWSLRTCRVKALHQLGPLPRLLALALAAHSPAGASEEESSADQAHLARMCGLGPQSLLRTLGLLVDTHFLESWAHDLTYEEVRWKLALPKQQRLSLGTDQKHPHEPPTTQAREPQPFPTMGY